MRGTHNVLGDIRDDLRAYDPLVSLLPSPDAIYEGHPADDRDFEASLTLSVASDVSTPHRGVIERTYRVQATVTVRRSWREWYDNRESEPSSQSQMGRMLNLVAERLDRAKPLPELPHGSEGGPQPRELDDGRLAMSEDWRVTGFYDDE